MADFAAMSEQHFLDLPNSPVDQADVLILPVPHDATVTYRKGTVEGPAAILDASEQLEFYEEDARWSPFEYMTLAVLEEIRCRPDEAQADFHARLKQSVSVMPENNLFIGLGGEHSITPDMLFARMPEGGTVIQLDAHADLRQQYHGSIYNHACPMYRIQEQGYDLIQVSIRSLHEQEAELINSNTLITTFFDRDLQKQENWERLLETIAALSGPVWLTIDMDGFDSALIAGVGTPQPGGLHWHQGISLIETLMNNKQADIRGVDILELIPEPNHVSDMMAAKLVQKCISFWGKSMGFDNRQKLGAQTRINDE